MASYNLLLTPAPGDPIFSSGCFRTVYTRSTDIHATIQINFNGKIYYFISSFLLLVLNTKASTYVTFTVRGFVFYTFSL